MSLIAALYRKSLLANPNSEIARQTSKKTYKDCRTILKTFFKFDSFNVMEFLGAQAPLELARVKKNNNNKKKSFGIALSWIW